MSATEAGRGNMIARNAMLSNKLRSLWDTQASLQTIAGELHCGASTVVRAVHELGLTPRPSAIRPGSNCAKKPEREAPMPVGPTVPQFKTVPMPPMPPPPAERSPRKCQWPISDGRPWKLCDEPCEGTYCAEHRKWSRFGRPKE